MIPTHHPPQEWLLAYASGSQGEALDLLVATHATLCPACRDRIRDMEEAAGAALNSESNTSIGIGTLEAVLARLDAQDPAPPPAPPRSASAVPRPLLELLPADRDKLPWSFVAPGIHQVQLPIHHASMPVRLFKLAPGLEIPQHTHAGLERTLVIEGGYSDDEGDFVRGDLGVRDGSKAHVQVIHEGDPCLALVVADARLVPIGLKSRVISWFARV